MAGDMDYVERFPVRFPSGACALEVFEMRSMSGKQRVMSLSHDLVQVKSIGTIFIKIGRYLAEPRALQFSCLSCPILANFNHKATYRRQTINIVSRHVGLLRLLVPC